MHECKWQRRFPSGFLLVFLLAVNGALILAAGIYQLLNPPPNPGSCFITCTPTSGGEQPCSLFGADLLLFASHPEESVRREYRNAGRTNQ